MPLKEFQNEVLLFPIGMGDVPEFDAVKFQLFKQVKQFYYMGEQDDNDVFACLEESVYKPKYPSAITVGELGQLHKVLGMDMQKERWLNTQKIYADLSINAEFHTYEGYGHTAKPAQNDLVETIEKHLGIHKDSARKL